MAKVIIETGDLDMVLNEVIGILTILHQEEDAGLKNTSLRIEINALESVANRIKKIGKAGCN